MVTRRQIKRLKNKLVCNQIKIPAIFKKGKSDKVRDIFTDEVITDQQLDDIAKEADLPTVVLVRGDKDRY